MNIKYMKFGNGPKNMVILPGLSYRPVTESAQAVMDAYQIFNDDFTVCLFDYREDPAEGTTVEDMADDVAEAIEELGLNDIYLYGVSMGGMVSQELVLKYPDSFKKLALCSTVAKVEDNPKLNGWKKAAQKKDIVLLTELFMRYVYTKEVYDQSIDIMISLYKNLSDEDLRNVAIRVDAVNGFDVTDRLKEIKLPVFFLGSKADQVFPYEQLKVIPDTLGCESYFYEGYSHAIYDEAPDIKERIHDFFME